MNLFHIYLLLDLNGTSRINIGLIIDVVHFLNLLLNVFILKILKVRMYTLEVGNNGLHLHTCILEFILELLELQFIFRFTLVLCCSNHLSRSFSTNFLSLDFGFVDLSHGLFFILNNSHILLVTNFCNISRLVC